MPKVSVYKVIDENEQIDVAKADEIELSDAVWATPLHRHAIYETVKMQLANRRQGTAATKSRGLVSGGGKKPWRQKGTGRARQGSIRAPQWVGGGTVFGPQPRNYEYKVPRKVRRLALRSALSAKLSEGGLFVLDSLNFDEPKTKRMLQILAKLGADRPLLVLEAENENAVKSIRNIPGALALTSGKINVYDLLNHSQLVLTRQAVANLEEVLA
jgi:large subunit ribosomal protein L4